MNNKKKMVLGAAFVVAIMALAGIGYAAATSYNGTTTSTTTSYDEDYVLVQLGTDGYVAPTSIHIVYDSNTTANADASVITTTYTKQNHDDSITYKVIVKDSGDTDDTFVLKAKLASAASLPDGYTLAFTYNDAEVTLSTSDTEICADKSIILTDVGVTFTISVNAPASIVKTDGTLPAATINIPAIVFTVVGTDST